MGVKRSRGAALVGLGAAARAFGVAAMLSTTTASTARADDFTDIINAVDGDYTDGQTPFTTAFTDFGGNELGPGLAAFFNGLDDDSLSGPDNLATWTVEALTNESVTSSMRWANVAPANFAAAVSEAQLDISAGETDLSEAATALSSGDYGLAALADTVGSDYLSVVPLEELLMVAAVSC